MDILNLSLIKSLTIVIVILIYWKLVYYKYHTKPITPLSYFAVGGALFFYGFYLYFFKKAVSLVNVHYVLIISALFFIISMIFVIIGAKKHGLNPKVDITLFYASKTFGKYAPYVLMIIAIPAFFFIMLATYYLLGEEHVVFWGMIFLAWIASNIRLIRKQILR